jgi:hypothetical protein
MFKERGSYVSFFGVDRTLGVDASIWAYFLLFFGAPKDEQAFVHQFKTKLLKRWSWKH